jgi:hypothetical protein
MMGSVSVDLLKWRIRETHVDLVPVQDPRAVGHSGVNFGQAKCVDSAEKLRCDGTAAAKVS